MGVAIGVFGTDVPWWWIIEIIAIGVGALLALGLRFRPRLFWPFELHSDTEQLRGLLVLLSIGLAFEFGILAYFADIGRVPRVGLPLAAFVIALFVASTNWRPRSLRVSAILAVVLLALVVFDIGRVELRKNANADELAELAVAQSTVRELETDLADLDKVRESSRATALRNAQQDLNAAIAEVGKQYPNAGDRQSELPGVAQAINSALRPVQSDDVTENVTSALAAFKENVYLVPTSPAIAALDNAVDRAVENYDALRVPSPAAVKKAINDACHASDGAVSNDTSAGELTCTTVWDVPPTLALLIVQLAPFRQALFGRQGSATAAAAAALTDSESDRTLAVAMAAERLELAKYRQAVLGRAEDDAAVQQATAALTSVQTEPPSPATETYSVVDAMVAGAQAIATALSEPGPPILIEMAGWILLALLALGFWRVVERRSFGQLPGPVTIELKTATSSLASPGENGEGGKDGGNDGAASEAPPTSAGRAESGGEPSPAPAKPDVAAQQAVFRVALLQNLTEPGALPGASALLPLTDLLEIPGVKQTWLTPLVTAIKSILAAPRGCAVSGDVVPPGKPGADWVVLVRVSDVATGEEVDVCTQVGKTDVQACLAAGYWAATVVLARSTRIAGWARWNKNTAAALAAFDDPSTRTIDDLKKAVALAPASGVLLQKLAARYDLEKRLVDSLSLSARAVAAHPRYTVARYRLAGSLNMFADNVAENWLPASISEKRRLMGQLKRASGAVNIDWTAPMIRLAGTDSAVESATIFRKLAKAFFNDLIRDSSRRGLLTRALRRSERDAWWLAGVAKFGKFSPGQVARWSVKSAALICDSAILDGVCAVAEQAREAAARADAEAQAAPANATADRFALGEDASRKQARSPDMQNACAHSRLLVIVTTGMSPRRPTKPGHGSSSATTWRATTPAARDRSGTAQAGSLTRANR